MPSPSEVTPWLPFLNSGGVIGLMVIIAYVFFKRKVRTEGELDDLAKMYEVRITEIKTDRDEWKANAMKQADTNGTIADQLTKVTDIVEALTLARGAP